MIEVSLSFEDLVEIIVNFEIVGQGTQGVLYDLGNGDCFKFNYREFNNFFEGKKGAKDLRCLSSDKNLGEYIRDLSENVKIKNYLGHKSLVKFVRKMADRQANMKYNQLPKGVVYVEGYPVGVILKRINNMVNLQDYIKYNGLSETEIKTIMWGLTEAVGELRKNFIYHFDITPKNVLYEPQSMSVQIVDFADVIVCDEVDVGFSAIMNMQLNEIDKFLQKYKRPVLEH